MKQQIQAQFCMAMDHFINIISRTTIGIGAQMISYIHVKHWMELVTHDIIFSVVVGWNLRFS